ncbi:unnamed protein product [Prunus armeniaca]|uniref:Uncharacterized protein n=1 Tax=Prunus armeniaca TaxID=36596 RepID=A0A6J5WVB6_PRUAR|nr:unnamed protein product [Prunus armeniaca]CAB4303977.1 unnamed protein product [Prunus armeniaca]
MSEDGKVTTVLLGFLVYVRIGLRWEGGWAGSFWAGECAGGVIMGAMEVGAEAWGLGDGKRRAMGARATDGYGSETGADADDDDDVTCGGIEEETTDATGMVGECTGTYVTGGREETQV